MRIALAFCLTLCAAPAAAWTFTASPVCTLHHDSADLSVTVTYDPRRAQAWDIALRRPGGWPEAGVFALRFEGPRGLTISTSRHRIAGESLSVSDTGFGNVLDGLAFNDRAVALVGDTAPSVPLDGAAPGVAALRACAEGGLA